MYKVFISEIQKSQIYKNIKLEKGVVLELSYDQIKTGGFLPIIIGLATAIGGLAGRRAAIANSVTGAKHRKAAEEETQRHNREIEKIAQNAKTIRTGYGLKKRRNPPLSNLDIKLVKDLKIKYFRDVFMKNELPKNP
jgi:hypothetical protein